jgi:hypothetical protein
VHALATADFQNFGTIEASKVRDDEVEDHELLQHLWSRDDLGILQGKSHEPREQFVGNVFQFVLRKESLETHQCTSPSLRDARRHPIGKKCETCGRQNQTNRTIV